METMRRVAILGRGGAGKSTLATRLGQITGLPVIELDKHFWQPGLVAPSPDQWASVQQEIAQRDEWIMDGDLGPYDVLPGRLRAADTIIVLDFPFVRCAWRAIRRSRERADFWRWLWSYRRRSLPIVMGAIATNADGAAVHVLRSPRALERFLAGIRQPICRWPRKSVPRGRKVSRRGRRSSTTTSYRRPDESPPPVFLVRSVHTRVP